MLGAAGQTHVSRTVHRRGRRGRRGCCGRAGYNNDSTGRGLLQHGPAEGRPELGLGEQESVHCWTGTTCLAVPLTCSDWSEEKDVGRSRLDRIEGSRDNGKQGRTGRRSRCAFAGFY
jgi:hypothetical protein